MAPSRRPLEREWVRAWKPTVAGVHEVFHARFVDYAYPPHVHDTWTVFVVDDGWIRYDLEHRRRGAGGQRVTILPPHVVHDGRAAGVDGFRKRVLYLGTDVLDERLTGRAVDAPDIHQPALSRAVHALHRALGAPDDALEAEARLAVVQERLRAHLGEPPSDLPGRHPGKLAGDLRELLDGHLFERTTLSQAGLALSASPAHLVRCFTHTFAIAPHQYVVARRIDAARRRLLDGEPIALVAAGVGFYDQAHFSRQFKRHVGTPPGRYAAGGGLPGRGGLGGSQAEQYAAGGSPSGRSAAGGSPPPGSPADWAPPARDQRTSSPVLSPGHGILPAASGEEGGAVMSRTRPAPPATS